MSKIYYVPVDNPSNSVYEFLIQELIKHLHSGQVFDEVYILDDDTKVVAVFNKQTGNFVTICQLTQKEETELKGTHNFGGGEG